MGPPPARPGTLKLEPVDEGAAPRRSRRRAGIHGRELRALAHYRPSQILWRLAIVARRRLASLAPGGRRARLARSAAAPPPLRDPGSIEPLEAFVSDSGLVAPTAADDLLAGTFRFLGETREFDAVAGFGVRGPRAPSHLWRMNLHYHRFLVDAVACAPADPARGDAILERAADLVARWETAYPPFTREGWEDAWNSYAVSTRLLHAWTARRLLGGLPLRGAAALAARLDALAAHGAAFLEGWLERDLGGNHLLRNACALAAAGEWFGGPEGERWRATGRSLLLAQLARQLLPDGFHEERSPMYHALALEDLLVSGVLAGTGSEELRSHAGRMLGALESACHPDGRIALFNDSAFGIAAETTAIRAFAEGHGVRALARGDLPAAGYYRFSGDRSVLIFDAGALGPDHLPAHAHCDALSFEWSVDGKRLVTDTGVDRYEAGPERDFQRSTAAHSTLQIPGRDQGEPFGSFRMGRRPRVTGRKLDERTVEGEHDGFRRGRVHARRLEWLPGSGLRWEDRVSGQSETEAVVRVGFAPGAVVRLEGTRAEIAAPWGAAFHLRTPDEGRLDVEAGILCERFGSSVARPVACWRGRAGRGRPLRFELARRG